MNTVYLIEYDNGAEWGDAYHYTVAVYATYEAAEAAIKAKGYTVPAKAYMGTIWAREKKPCPFGKGHISARCETCNVLCPLEDDCRDFFTIREMPVLDAKPKHPSCSRCVHTECPDSGGQICDHFREKDEYRECPECGEQTPKRYATCSRCGMEIGMAEWVCSRCGKVNTEEFPCECYVCGKERS